MVRALPSFGMIPTSTEKLKKKLKKFWQNQEVAAWKVISKSIGYGCSRKGNDILRTAVTAEVRCVASRLLIAMLFMFLFALQMADQEPRSLEEVEDTEVNLDEPLLPLCASSSK